MKDNKRFYTLLGISAFIFLIFGISCLDLIINKNIGSLPLAGISFSLSIVGFALCAFSKYTPKSSQNTKGNKCPKCGTECNGNFCSNCGSKIETPEKAEDNKQYVSEFTLNPDVPNKANNNEKRTVIGLTIIGIAVVLIIIGVVFQNSKNINSNSSYSYNTGNNEEDVDDDEIESEPETEPVTEKEKTVNDYKKVSAKDLCYNSEKYRYDYLRTTFKINKISGNHYKYITYGIGKYDKVEISCPLNDEDMELDEGVNVTVGGLCSLKRSTYEGEYGETRAKLTIELTGGVWKIPKKSNFKPFGKTKSEAYLSSFPKLYSDYNVDIYYIDAEDDYGDVEARFLVNNKTSKQLTFQADTITFDGRSYNNIIMSDDVAANSKGLITPTISDCKNDSPKTVGFSFRYFDKIFNNTIRKEITAYSQKVK